MRWAHVTGGSVTAVVEATVAPQITFGGTWEQDPLGRAEIGGTWAAGLFVRPERQADPCALLTRKQFWKRWTRNERENLHDVRENGTAAQRRRLGAFLESVSDGDIDVSDNYWTNQLLWMETSGANVLGAGNSILAVGRGAAILAGT